MKIAIITGGKTGERSVSINSAENIKSQIHFTECGMYIFPEDEKNFLQHTKIIIA